MQRSSVSPQNKGKSKSLQKAASGGLVDFLKAQYPKNVPVSALTAVSKYYTKGKPLNKDDKIVKRLAGKDSTIPTASLIDLISAPNYHEKGKPLTDQGVRRVYQCFANPEGKLTFEYIMKMGENLGMTITEKMAKRMVKKYGKKDFLTAEDCVKISSRRSTRSKDRK